MSYSFSLKAATKAAALAAAAAKFDAEVLAQQPVHRVDRDAALANAEKHLALVAEPVEGEEVSLSMYGSVGGDVDHGTGDVRRLTTAGSGCTASIIRVPPAA